MPRVSRQRNRAHDQTVRPSKRVYAVQENQVEHVEVGAAEGVSATEVLDNISAETPGQARNVLSKKVKQRLKHEVFLDRLERSRSPYSKSHSRRLKRKAKERIGGGLSDIQAAIAEMEDDTPELAQETIQVAETTEPGDINPHASATEQRVKPISGLIGEGKGAPLTKAQRKRALQLEKKRHPMILGNPVFSANPFETIRIHAQNTLLKHQLPK